MKTLTKDQVKEIAARLRERNAIRPCPCCGEQHCTVMNQIFFSMLNLNIKHGIPCAVTVCENCGHLASFSLIRLGLIQLAERTSHA